MPSHPHYRGATNNPPFQATVSEYPLENPFASPLDAAAQDIAIPAHLLQASATAGSKRDEGEESNWEPQRQLSVRRNPSLAHARPARHVPVLQRPPAVKRSSTVPSRSSTPRHSAESSRSAAFDALTRSATVQGGQDNEENNARLKKRRVSFADGLQEPSSLYPPRRSWRSSIMSDYSEPDEKRTSWRFSPPLDGSGPTISAPGRQSWRLSYSPGDADRLTLSPHTSIADFSRSAGHDEPGFTDPFADPPSHGNQVTITPPSPSASSVQRERPRRGTLESVVNAIVPETIQRKMTQRSANGLTRTSSMRKTFEKAKIRGAELQREKWVQIVFEYGIYLFLLCFVYFVLIGMPLWKGAVWWLYWVVANKFVIAGGFGIVLGVALL